MEVGNGQRRRRETLAVADVEAAAGLLRLLRRGGRTSHSWGTRLRVLLRCQGSAHRRAAVEASAAGLSGLRDHRGAGPCQQSSVAEPDVPLAPGSRVHLVVE